jgi:PAS domain S-box-containing protein
MDVPDEVTSRGLRISHRLLFEHNPVPMWVYDAQTLKMLAVNAAALAQYGYSREEFVSLTLLDLHHPNDEAQLRKHLDLAVHEKHAPTAWRHRNRNGEWIEVETVTEEVEVEGIHARVALVRDMTALRRAERAQNELAQQLNRTLESISDAFLTLDPEWRFLYLNSQAERLINRSRDQLLGRNIWDAFPESAGSVFQLELKRAIAQSCTVSFEDFYAPLGAWMSVTAYPTEQGLAVYCRDVTQKHAADQRLSEERETLRAVVNTSSDGILITDADGLIQLLNPAAEHVFGRSQESLLDQAIEVLLPLRYRAAHCEHRRRFVASGASNRMMGLGIVKGLHADGHEIDLEGTISQVTVQGNVLLIVGLKNVGERLEMQANFQKSRAQLASLTHRFMTQEKTLVKGIAQVMHDQVGQTMAAIRMAHETIVTLQNGHVSADMTRLQAQLGTLIGQAIRQVRQVLVDLRPPLLEEHGLAAALDNELRNRSLAHQFIDISMHVPTKVDRMRWPPEVEYAAFMVVREAVENALRHSGASTVSVRITGAEKFLKIEVGDNGVGIKPGESLRVGHLGILGMQERASAVGASIKIDAGKLSGARVTFRWRHTLGWGGDL